MKLGLGSSDQLSTERSTRQTASFAMRKIVMVGDSGVGKTAILSRFCNG